MFKLIEKYFKRRARLSLYKDFEVKDFLCDEFFVKWAVNNDAETAHFWEKWLRNNPEKVPQVLEAKEVAYRMNYKKRYELSNQQYTDMYEAILNNSLQKEYSYFQSHEFRKWLTIAAIFCLGIIVPTYFFSNSTSSTEQILQAKTLSRYTKPGEKSTIILSDGTKVKLNSESAITYPAVFSDSIREIQLMGEAFFEVSHNPDKPFIVKSGDVNTTVLGTSFNINAHPENDQLQVTLATGSVRIGTAENKMFLSPGQQAIYDKTTLTIEKQEVDISQYLAWSNDIIIFDDIKLSEAAKILERWYDVEISFENPNLGNCYIQGSYEDESLINILQSFKFVKGVDYEFKENNSVLIKGTNCL